MSDKLTAREAAGLADRKNNIETDDITSRLLNAIRQVAEKGIMLSSLRIQIGALTLNRL